MGAIDVAKTVKNNQGKKGRNNEDIYMSGYHMLGGLVSAMVIGFAWDKVKAAQQTKITTGLISGNPIKNVGDGIAFDKVITMSISTALTMAELFGGVKGAASAGAGMMIGYTYLDKSKQQKYIGNF